MIIVEQLVLSFVWRPTHRFSGEQKSLNFVWAWLTYQLLISDDSSAQWMNFHYLRNITEGRMLVQDLGYNLCEVSSNSTQVD